jgi:hypothetical protein
MKRSVILLVMSAAAALAQQSPTPQPEAWRMQAWKNAMRGSDKNLTEQGQPLQAWKNALRGPHVNLMLSAPPKACAVPLLPAPVDPHAGEKMPVSKPPAKKIEPMLSAEGLPPCPRA